MHVVLIVIHVMVTLALVAMVLLQRNAQDGLSGIGGGGSGALMSGRSSANLLTKATSILATIFIANCLLMAVLTARSKDHESLLNAPMSQGENTKSKTSSTQPAAPAAPKTPAVPKVPMAQ